MTTKNLKEKPKYTVCPELAVSTLDVGLTIKYSFYTGLRSLISK